MPRNLESWGYTSHQRITNSARMYELPIHKPVLLREVLEAFSPQLGEKFIDATINGGGHARAILNLVGEKGMILGIDWDCELIEKLKDLPLQAGEKNLKLICGNYADIKHIVTKYNFGPVAGILADLGFSSYHLEKSGRGFSFLRDEALDMRYNIEQNTFTAEKIINDWPLEKIENVIRTYGEERFAGRIARGIGVARTAKKISTTGGLARIIERTIPARFRGTRLHPATRTFQALRIAVNHELENLERAVPDMIEVLNPQGKIAIISFHSLEDRIVKNIFRNYQKTGDIKIITKKPITASFMEQKENPRARSAKLRVAQKL